MTTKAKSRMKQAVIPGAEVESVPEIDEAAERLWEFHTERTEAAEQEKAAGEVLMDLMREHKVSFYEHEKFTVRLESKNSVKVKRRKPVERNGDGETP